MSIRDTVNEVLSSHSSPEARINRLYESVEAKGYDWGAPDAAEFNYFMDIFKVWVAAEQKGGTGKLLAQPRAQAIADIQRAIPGGGTPAFDDIQPFIFGIQLALRVRRPRSIDQGDTGLCGAVSAMFTFAKTRPREFAFFARSLFFTGQGHLGATTITASERIRHGWRLRQGKIRWALDYVVLVSLRQCTFFSDIYGIGAVRPLDETTLPGQLCDWLEQTGYTNVEDHTFFGKHQQPMVNAFAAISGHPAHQTNAFGDSLAQSRRLDHSLLNLRQAIRELTAERIVILFCDGELAEAMRDQTGLRLRAREQPTPIGRHHWMAVRGLTILHPGTRSEMVKLKAVTWSKHYEECFGTTPFLSRYNGYIVATP